MIPRLQKWRTTLMRKLLVVVCLMATPCVSRAEKSNAWDTLSALRTNEKIEVVEANLKQHKGIVVAVSEESITLRENAADQTIKKENVMRVTALDKGHRWRNVLFWGAVGAGVGAGVGAAASGKCFCTTGQAMKAVGLVGLAAGAVVGVALPSHDTIYRAKPR
jgi:hypothetical protein